MRAYLLIGSLVVVACSSTGGTASDGDVSTDSATSGDASTDVPSDGSGAFICPPTAPTGGAPCAIPSPGLWVCEYGGDVHGACTDLFACATSKPGETLHWITYEKNPTCGTNAPDCATSFGIDEGKTCSVSGETCDYADGRCGCERCATDASIDSRWHCKKWTDVGAGCPSPRPLLGSTCTSEGLTCDYAECCNGPSMGPLMHCIGGIWEPAPSGACSCAIPTCG